MIESSMPGHLKSSSPSSASSSVDATDGGEGEGLTGGGD